MSESPFTSFAAVGAGTVGTPMVQALLARNVPVVVLTRPTSSAKLPAGAKIAPVNYADVAAVTSILRSNKVDAVVSTLSGEGFASQKPIADAAKAAGVKLFVPSEFGMPSEGVTDGLVALKAQFAGRWK